MSIAAMKRKTLNGNPRLAPVSGSNNGRFGFSLNGTRRNVGRVQVTNLAPGAMSGPSQMIGSTVARPTGPGIHGHPSSVCTNDPLVVKTSVINTRGMLSRRAYGFSRAVPMAPYRDGRPEECGLGVYIAPPEEYDICGKDNNKTCPPIWVKKSIVPNGDQGQYISRFVKVRGGAQHDSLGGCDSTKSWHGLIGYIDGLPIPNPSCNTSWGIGGWKPVEGLLFAQRGNFIGTRRKTSNCPVTKPGLLTVNYADYNSRRVLIKNALPSRGFCAPVPLPMFNVDAQCRVPNPYNVNVPAAQNPASGAAYNQAWISAEIAPDGGGAGEGTVLRNFATDVWQLFICSAAVAWSAQGLGPGVRWGTFVEFLIEWSVAINGGLKEFLAGISSNGAELEPGPTSMSGIIDGIIETVGVSPGFILPECASIACVVDKFPKTKLELSNAELFEMTC